MQTGQPEIITQTPVPLSSLGATPAARAAVPAMAPSFEETLTKESVLPARHMVRKGESATPDIDHVATESSDLSFYDLLDVINPLQHIPIVSDYYREATGDTIRPEVRLAGGTLLGGVFGFFASLGGLLFEEENGKSISQTVIASLTGDDDDAAEEKTEIASNEHVSEETPAAQPVQQASAVPAATSADDAILSVFGNPNASAHASYTQANMRNYLHDVTVSEKL